MIHDVHDSKGINFSKLINNSISIQKLSLHNKAVEL